MSHDYLLTVSLDTILEVTALVMTKLVADNSIGEGSKCAALDILLLLEAFVGLVKPICKIYYFS